MEILQRHNDKSRRQAITSYNLNKSSDNMINNSINLNKEINNKDTSMRTSIMTRGRISSNYTDMESENIINEELKLESFSEFPETKDKDLFAEQRLKRNTFSTLDPNEAKIISAKFQAEIKSKPKSPKKMNTVAFKIPESEVEENSSKESEEEGFSGRLKKIKITHHLSNSSSSEDSNRESNNKDNHQNSLMDSVKVFKVYFPHNNVNMIFENIKNIEKIKLRRFQRKHNDINNQNKNFWDFFKFKNIAERLKKVKQIEKSEESSPKTKEFQKQKTKKCFEKNQYEVDEKIHKKIFRKIRQSERKDSLILQILKQKVA